MTYITYITYIRDIHYIHDIRHIRDIHYTHYIHYRQYIQYIQYIQDIHDIHYRHIAFPEVSIHDTTRHDMTLLHILTYGSCAHGKGKGTEEKKAELCTFMLLGVTNTSSPCSPIFTCRAEACLLCCQPDHPSVAAYLIIKNYSMIALQTASLREMSCRHRC